MTNLNFPWIILFTAQLHVNIASLQMSISGTATHTRDGSRVAFPSSSTRTRTANKPQQDGKYNYSEDQWSPWNPEGKNVYDRHFLLDLQFRQASLVKPSGLNKRLDIFLDVVS